MMNNLKKKKSTLECAVQLDEVSLDSLLYPVHPYKSSHRIPVTISQTPLNFHDRLDLRNQFKEHESHIFIIYIYA